MKSILVPTDFSPISKSAALYAIKLAHQMKAQVTIVSVIDLAPRENTLSNWGELQKIQQQAAEQSAQRMLKELKSELANLKVSFHVLSGASIEEEVLHFAKERNIDLIVAGTKGATGLKRAVLGSNTAALINKSDIPIIAVPNRVAFNDIQRIVLASDMQGLQEQAMFVTQFAKDFDCRVDILHVVKPGQVVPNIAQLEESLIENTKCNQIYFNVVQDVDTEHAIHQYVLQNETDLLVMFTHKLDMLERLLRKSVTREITLQSHIPLMVIKKDLLVR